MLSNDTTYQIMDIPNPKSYAVSMANTGWCPGSTSGCTPYWPGPALVEGLGSCKILKSGSGGQGVETGLISTNKQAGLLPPLDPSPKFTQFKSLG